MRARRLSGSLSGAHAFKLRNNAENVPSRTGFFGRGGQIRTADLTDPNRARYQTALRPVHNSGGRAGWAHLSNMSSGAPTFQRACTLLRVLGVTSQLAY